MFDRSTQELRLAWCKLHRTEPPAGVSRDLLIRSLAHELQQRANGRPNLALRRRLPTSSSSIPRYLMVLSMFHPRRRARAWMKRGLPVPSHPLRVWRIRTRCKSTVLA
ncbi:MAG: DUF2924 domain-containing protein [Alphaproteobacteria bacterium]|nr:DUF2924 domain-containing protein [Alphaproteobacteria bacterium]MBV9374905.1 DUF2924 domain-containing protein [Alphaproteobacteria bacterium]